jgi:hypothetical protein
MPPLVNARFSRQAVVAAMALLCAACSQKPRHEEYYLPCGYVGWVNLIYEHDGPSRVFSSGDTTRYLLTGDLVNCYVHRKEESGGFTDRYFYYCPANIRRLKSGVPYKTYVPITYFTSIQLAGKTHSVRAFYVANRPMDRVLAASADSVPPNPLQNAIPATIMPPGLPIPANVLQRMR